MLEIKDPVEYNNFHNSLRFVLKWEGEYSNDPTDPGGETKWGISKRAHPNLDIKNLTPEQACEVYYSEYWLAASCNQLKYPLCLALFDTAVNCGVSRATAWLRTVGSDVDTYLNARKAYYVSLVRLDPSKQRFLQGWLNRVADLQKLADLANADVQTPPQPPQIPADYIQQ